MVVETTVRTAERGRRDIMHVGKKKGLARPPFPVATRSGQTTVFPGHWMRPTTVGM